MCVTEPNLPSSDMVEAKIGRSVKYYEFLDTFMDEMKYTVKDVIFFLFFVQNKSENDVT